ncbi:MAG TPA: hypothetical protein VF715_14995 [Thermoleophilaceae bacterium]
MTTSSRPRRALAVSTLLLAFALPPSAGAAESRACDPIVNPYAGTRYEGTDIRKIRAVGVSCSTARSVARGAHKKALGMTPPPSGVRRFEYKGWKVTGDLRGDDDRYVASRGGKRVRWVF